MWKILKQCENFWLQEESLCLHIKVIVYTRHRHLSALLLGFEHHPHSPSLTRSHRDTHGTRTWAAGNYKRKPGGQSSSKKIPLERLCRFALTLDSVSFDFGIQMYPEMWKPSNDHQARSNKGKCVLLKMVRQGEEEPVSWQCHCAEAHVLGCPHLDSFYVREKDYICLSHCWLAVLLFAAKHISRRFWYSKEILSKVNILCLHYKAVVRMKGMVAA